MSPKYINKFKNFFLSSKVWLSVTVISSMLICISITWIYYKQKQTLNQERLMSQNIRLARIDLSKGFLHITLSKSPSSPFKKEVGYAYLKQAISSFKNELHLNHKSPHSILVDNEVLTDFNNNIELFQQSLFDYIKFGNTDPKLETILRINYATIERQADLIDSLIKKDINELSSVMDTKFFATIFMAGFLLLSICLTLYYIILKNEKSNKELLISERELSKQRYLFEIMFNSITDGVVITNTKREIILANKGIETTFGYKPDDVIGNSTQILYADNDKYEQAGKNVSNEKALSEGRQYVTFYKDKKHKVFPGETFGAKLYDNEGVWIGNLGIIRDISERMNFIEDIKKAKEKAEESEYQLKERVKEINGLFSLGVLADKFDNLEDIYTEFIQKVVSNSMQFPDKTIALLEIDGKSYSNTTNFNLYKNNDKLSAPIKVFEKINGELTVTYTENIPFIDVYEQKLIDAFAERISKITEHIKSLHNLQKAKEKAEENDRLKSAFLANMSHEIRTPMNSILGFSELLMNEELSEEKQEKYHEIVNNSGKRLMNLINDIVDISKIDAKEIKLNLTVFNLNALIDQLQHQFSISPKNMNTVISTVKCVSEKESYINCDEARLAQVLSNLLENALKFTHNGTVEFGYTINEKELQFFVKDSGVGINEKDHQHIFERFGQSDNEILKVKEGSGLGLSICKGIVELFGGKIWVESEPYQGATFYFTIPNCILVNGEDQIEKVVNNTIVESKTTKTILIAEDEETNFWFLEAALEGHPFNLIHALNGKEAVEIMQTNHNIDLILMDFNMPVMNGMEATKEIRKTNKTIPIIAVTAYAMMADKDKALEIGCTDYLSKPVSRDLLLETINKYIHKV